MMTINWKELKDKLGKERVVINCINEEDSRDLLENLHELGYRWCTGDSLIKRTNYDVYLGETCYCINIDGKLTYENIDWFKCNYYEVYEYIRSDNGMRKSDLKTGMVVKLRNGEICEVYKDCIKYEDSNEVDYIIDDNGYYIELNKHYNDKLKCEGFFKFDIMEVRRNNHIINMIDGYDYNKLELLWSRVVQSRVIQMVVANHFGSTEDYHWKTQLGVEYNIGDIVEVETSTVNRLVEVKKTYYANESDKYKNVIRKVEI